MSRRNGNVSIRVGSSVSVNSGRKDALADLILPEERVAAFHQAAVVADKAHEYQQVADGRRTEDDIICPERELLRRVVLIALQQERQFARAAWSGFRSAFRCAD